MDAPTRLPAVSITQIDSSVVKRMSTLKIENADYVQFQIDAYDNTIGYKKQKTKEILADIDEIMCSLGFTRMESNQLPNLADASIYHMFARYEAIVDTDLIIYQT